MEAKPRLREVHDFKALVFDPLKAAKDEASAVPPEQVWIVELIPCAVEITVGESGDLRHAMQALTRRVENFERSGARDVESVVQRTLGHLDTARPQLEHFDGHDCRTDTV